MKIRKTQLLGVLEITPPTIFQDHRGEYVETYNEDLYKNAGIGVNFIQDDISVSKKNVLRGIHGDQKTWKLVSCLFGSFYLVVVNNDPNSIQFKKYQHFILDDKNRKQILIPPKFGNGHLVTSKTSIFHYKQSTNYDRDGQFTILWNDPEFDIKWPIKNPITSERDSGR